MRGYWRTEIQGHVRNDGSCEDTWHVTHELMIHPGPVQFPLNIYFKVDTGYAALAGSEN